MSGRAILLLSLLSVGLVLGNFEYYKDYTASNDQSYINDYPTCNKTSIKVTNKVPVYDLCYWDKIEWNNFVKRTDVSPCNLHGTEGNYIVSRCIPTKIRLYNGRAYVIIDRNIGVYSTLNYFNLKDVGKDKKCPKLECFRECSRNELADLSKCTDNPVNFLINVRDIQFNTCKEAWVLDIGAYFDGKSHVIQRPPRICRYDVSSPTAAQQYCSTLPSRYYNDGNQFGFNTIQVSEEKGCGSNFVYIFNAVSATIIVYSESDGSFSSIRSRLFRPEPSQSLFRFTLPNNDQYETIVHDGIFSGAVDKYGLFISPKASDDLYFVSYNVLNDKSNEDCNELSYNIKDLGTYNDRGQTYGIARNGNVLFFIQPQNYALVCANKKENITPDSLQYLAVDRCRFPHLSSIDIYQDTANNKEIYLLSNNLIDTKVNGFDSRKKNFVISTVDLNEVEALYPQCLSYFEEFYGDECIKDEIALARSIADRKPGQYELYDDRYQHKECPDTRLPNYSTKSYVDKQPTYVPEQKPCSKPADYSRPSLESLIKTLYARKPAPCSKHLYKPEKSCSKCCGSSS